MKTIKLLVTGLAVILSLNTYAQDNTTTATTTTATTSSTKETASQRGLQLSIGAEGALPIGSFKSQSGYKFGLGGSLKLGLPLTSNLDGTISAGFMTFSRSKLDVIRSENTFTAIPFKAGLQIHTNSGFYFEPQVGFTQTKISNEEGSGVFTYAGNIGYLIAKSIDIAVRYEAMASRKGQVITGATREDVSAKMIGLRVAYNIPFARVK